MVINAMLSHKARVPISIPMSALQMIEGFRQHRGQCWRLHTHEHKPLEDAATCSLIMSGASPLNVLLYAVTMTVHSA